MKWILVIITTLFLSCSLQEKLPEGDTTLMFYLGDDTGSSRIGLINDLIELTSKEVDISTKRVVILIDDSDNGDTELYTLDSPFDINFRKIPVEETPISTKSNSEANMGDSATLESYINFVKEKIPSKYYALYIGGHGTGYSSNYESSMQLEINDREEDLLTVIEIANVLERTGGVDLIAFDACLMGSIENIYELKNSADFLVASPENIPGPGNNYIKLINSFYLDSTKTPWDLAKATVESYYFGYSLVSQTQSPWIKDRELLQLYNIKEIVKIIETETFETTLINTTLSAPTDNPKYNRGTISGQNLDDPLHPSHFIGEYSELNIDSVDNYIFTVNDTEKLISVYNPSGSYNNTYSKSSFSIKFPNWTNYIKN